MVKALRDPASDRFGYLLRRASTVMMADLGRALAAVTLRPVEATILILVGANPGCTQAEVGRTLGIRGANMVPLIARLIARGLLAKSRADGRSHGLTLTASGQVSCARVDAIMDAHEARFAGLLAAYDAPRLRDALTAVAAHSEGVTTSDT